MAINWIEVRARVEQCATTLTTRYVSREFQADDELRRLLDKALADCTPEAGGEGVLELAWQYGISLDWFFRGDVAGFICAAAAGAQSRQGGYHQPKIQPKIAPHPWIMPIGGIKRSKAKRSG